MAGESCDGMVYGDQNQVDYKIRISRLKGFAVDARSVAVPGVCVGLFAEADHKLIAVTLTDENGRFGLPKVPSGLYRLVGRYGPFGIANAQIRIGRRGSSSIILKVLPGGIDQTSYFEIPATR